MFTAIKVGHGSDAPFDPGIAPGTTPFVMMSVMASSETTTPADGPGAPNERPTPGGADAATPDASHREAQKAMVRARMFGTAAAKIGRYAILEVLGEGGMGTVYACFDDQLDRKIALKLVKGTATHDARARMLREARAMAKLSHPNVVPVFEVGEHLGRLYVAMEYVRGSTLRQWQEAREHDRNAILEAYDQAGRGLAAAHAEGLVHRDFKPHNAVVGEDGRVRVLDFGIATQRDAAPTARASEAPKVTDTNAGLTETGRVLGTPAYMAPEQASGGAVDHRSDQYAFCVALWEGLYGTRPTATSEDTPPPDQADAIQPLLRRGLQPVADDRWPSMDTLLAALTEAVAESEEHTAPGRRLAVLIGGGILLVGGAVVGQQQLDAHRTQTCETEAQQQTEAMWNDTLRTSVGEGLKGTGLSFATMTAERSVGWLDEYAETWRKAAAETCVAARVEHTSSEALHERVQWCLESRALAFSTTVDGLVEADRTAATKAVSAVVALPDVAACTGPRALQRLPLPPSDDARDAVTQARVQIARAETLATMGHHDAAVTAARGAVDLAERLGDAPLRATSVLTLGLAQRAAGVFDDAEKSLTDAYFAAIDASDPQTAGQAGTQLVELVGVDLARPAEGFVWARHTQAAWDTLGLPDDDLMVARSVAARAQLHSGRKGYDDAKALYDQVRKIREDQLGPDHPLVARSLHSLAAVAVKAGAFAEATETQTRGMKINEHAFGPDHPVLAADLNVLAVAAASVGDFATARTQWVRALDIREAALGPNHPDLGLALENLGGLHGLLGEWDECIALTERALKIQETSLGPSHPRLAPKLMNLGEMYTKGGRPEDSRAALERAVAILDGSPGSLPLDHAEALGKLGLALREEGNLPRARTQHERAIALLEASLGLDHAVRARELGRLSAVLMDADELPLASARARQALKVFATHDGAQEGELETVFLEATLAVRLGEDPDAAISRVRALHERLADNNDAASQALRPRVEAWLSSPQSD
ncbi:MAG: tetratricopeptide repeat protein [Deltaproteobacteria bacterium]|nr:tetratricopeptide repeat protein [Deltaproteobacteria bacterium]